MSAYEQRIEPPDKSWQYLLFAAEPYETIAFKVCFLKIVYAFNRLSQESGKCKYVTMQRLLRSEEYFV